MTAEVSKIRPIEAILKDAQRAGQANTGKERTFTFSYPRRPINEPINTRVPKRFTFDSGGGHPSV